MSDTYLLSIFGHDELKQSVAVRFSCIVMAEGVIFFSFFKLFLGHVEDFVLGEGFSDKLLFVRVKQESDSPAAHSLSQITFQRGKQLEGLLILCLHFFVIALSWWEWIESIGLEFFKVSLAHAVSL